MLWNIMQMNLYDTTAIFGNSNTNVIGKCTLISYDHKWSCFLSANVMKSKTITLLKHQSVQLGKSKVKKKFRLNFQSGHDAMCTELSAVLDVNDAHYNILVW